MVNHGNNAFIGIGANKENRKESCRMAIGVFKDWPEGEIVKVSSFYESEPWGYEDQDQFVNCVIKIKTSLDAFGLLLFLQEAEIMLGKKKDFYWGPRNIDLDLLFFNDAIIDTPHLKVPHPFLQQRRFVLEPMAEIEPGFIHPVLKQPISVLLKETSDSKKVVKVNNYPHRG